MAKRFNTFELEGGGLLKSPYQRYLSGIPGNLSARSINTFNSRLYMDATSLNQSTIFRHENFLHHWQHTPIMGIRTIVAAGLGTVLWNGYC